MRGNDHHGQAIELREFLRGRLRRSRHAAELRIQLGKMDQRNGAADQAFRLDRQPFFGLDGRLKAVGPVPVLDDPAGEFVDQLDFALAHDVIHVAGQQNLGVESLVKLTHEKHILRQIRATQGFLGPVEPRVRQISVPSVLVRVVIHPGLEGTHRFRYLVWIGHDFVRAARNHQRDARLVDENGIRLIHQGEMKGSVDEIPFVLAKVVAQKVEARLFCRAVGDVATIGVLPVSWGHSLLDEADAQTQEFIDGPHPLRIPAGQIIVECQHMDPVAGPRVETDGGDGRERLALAGLHLDQFALMQSYAGQHLDVERMHAEYAPGDFAHQAEGLDEQLVRRDAGPCASRQLL